MSAYFLTTNPTQLLTSFRKAIDEGHVVTWAYDKDGDFTHNVPQWKNLAWMRPVINGDRLSFRIIRPTNKSVTPEVYAVFHGRLIESLIAHCDKLFTSGCATALADSNDLV